MNTLLIVEDNEFERHALLHYVDWDELGVQVVDAAMNGKEGLEKARQHRPDLILSDVMMPVMDGIEMAKAIVQFSPGTKFIFSSGHDDVGLLQEALELRAYSYLIKPLRQEELVASLRKIAAVSMDEKLSRRASRKMTEQFQSGLPHLQAKFLEELMHGAIKPEETDTIYAQVGGLKLQVTGAYKRGLAALTDTHEFRYVIGVSGAAPNLAELGLRRRLRPDARSRLFGPDSVDLELRAGHERGEPVVHQRPG